MYIMSFSRAFPLLFFGGLMIISGAYVVRNPQRAFELRHEGMLEPESSLSREGREAYQLGGIVWMLAGLLGVYLGLRTL